MIATWLFLLALALWSALSLVRFVHLYDLTSPFQRWRRFDPFKLVPVGAFFGPEPPPLEYCLLVRDLLDDAHSSAWTEVPRLRERVWWHAFWNPQKHLYKARSSAARRLMMVWGHYQPADEPELSARVVLSNEYFKVLRYVSRLPRVGTVRAVQFAVLERDVVTKVTQRALISLCHEM